MTTNLQGNDFQVFYCCGYQPSCVYLPDKKDGFDAFITNLKNANFTGLIANNQIFERYGLPNDYFNTQQLNFLIEISYDIKITKDELWRTNLIDILTKTKDYAYGYQLTSEVLTGPDNAKAMRTNLFEAIKICKQFFFDNKIKQKPFFNNLLNIAAVHT